MCVVCLHRCAGVHMHVEVTGQPLESFLRICLPCSVRSGLSLVHRACRLVAPGAPRSACLCLSVTEVASVYHLAPPFYTRIEI